MVYRMVSKGSQLTLDSFTKKAKLEAKNVISERSSKNGWIWVRLGDFVETTSGGTPLRSRKEYFGGNIPWVKSGELEDNWIFNTEETITEEGLRNSNAKIFPKGTLLVAMYGATVGKTAILGVDAATNQAVCAIFPKKDLIDPFFIRYFIIWKRDELIKSSFGGAQPNISQTVIRNLMIPLPFKDGKPDIEEQRRVVARIEEITAKIEQAKKLREEALKETEKIMQTALHQIFSKPEQKGWKLSTLEEVAPIQSNSIQSLNPDKLYNYISLEHIESNTGRLINFAPTPGAEIKSSKIAFTKEHVLYGKLRPYLNKVFVPDFDGICTTELVPLSPRKETITREFLAWQLRSPQFVNYAMSNLTGTRMPRISIEALKNAKVAIPPIDEQIRIAALLDKLQNQLAEIRQRQKETVEKLEKMTQTILKKAFMGEL